MLLCTMNNMVITEHCLLEVAGLTMTATGVISALGDRNWVTGNGVLLVAVGAVQWWNSTLCKRQRDCRVK